MGMDGTKERLSIIRTRTWTLTALLLVTLVFYLIADVVLKSSIDFLDFLFTASLQIITHFIYFPDGEVYGALDKAFLENRKLYNEKATKINTDGKFESLREYCKHDFEERKKRYIENECALIGITIEELESFKDFNEKQISKLEAYEFKDKKVVFNRNKRDRLYNLIFKELPVEYNYPETIMSAVENDGRKAIRDGSVRFKKASNTKRILVSVFVGILLGYIGYSLTSGFGFANVVSIFVNIATIFTSAVMSFTGGEKSNKVYKNLFFIELINFLDGFEEYDKKRLTKQN